MCRSGSCTSCVEGRVRAVTRRKASFVLANVSVPLCTIQQEEAGKDTGKGENASSSRAVRGARNGHLGLDADADVDLYAGRRGEGHPVRPASPGPPSSAKWDEGTVLVDIHVDDGRITAISPTRTPSSSSQRNQTTPWMQRLFSLLSSRSPRFLPAVVDCEEAFVLPTFVDLHTHIDKGHTAERSTNTLGSLSGADRSTAADAAFWSAADVEHRMEFSLKCAYAHGTSALRTHLINMTPKHIELTWPAFAKVRDRWRGRVEVQGVALVALSFFRDEAASTRLADTVAAYGGLLGAAVCCAEEGGSKTDDWTTCDGDRDELLDRIFTLAKERDLDLDFHTDENGNEAAKGLRYVAEKAIQHGYEGRVVCGHCCSLAYQPPRELQKTLELARRARITIVSLPLVNQWTQDRRYPERTTPLWRGVTRLHEARDAGVAVAIASDNTRDQFYAYGDLDMLEVFNQGCRMAHLDRPYGSWVNTVGATPAAAMGLVDGMLRVGGKADFVVFPNARKYSELLSRPQGDGVVVRGGRRIKDGSLPGYKELDCVVRNDCPCRDD